MPLISVKTSVPMPAEDAQRALLSELSAAVAAGLGKPESYVMTSLEPDVPMSFAGTFEPVCLANLSSIGTMTPRQTSGLSAALCRILSERLGVAANRVYLGFHDVERHLWGWDGRTFAG